MSKKKIINSIVEKLNGVLNESKEFLPQEQLDNIASVIGYFQNIKTDNNIKALEKNKENDCDNTVYCSNCGNDEFPRRFSFEDKYANGNKFNCKECGDSLWLSDKRLDEVY